MGPQDMTSPRARRGCGVAHAALVVALALGAGAWPAAARRLGSLASQQLDSAGSTLTHEIAASESQAVELPLDAGAF